MVVNGDRQRLLGVLLADARQIELAFDLGGLGHADAGLVFPGLGRQFLVEHLFAQDDAIVADENSRPLNEFFDLGVRLAAKTAKRDVRRPRHRSSTSSRPVWAPYPGPESPCGTARLRPPGRRPWLPRAT